MSYPIDNLAVKDLEELGREADVVTPTTPVRDDDHGDYRWTGENRTATTVDVATRGSPRFSRLSSGVGATIDAFVWVKATISVQTGESAMDAAASYIEVDDRTWVVRDIFDEDNGLLRLACEEGSR